jgi:hypothetical protein
LRRDIETVAVETPAFLARERIEGCSGIVREVSGKGFSHYNYRDPIVSSSRFPFPLIRA